ncbi:MAG: OmpA family protein [Leptospiraceae bacterium]|nr:OmpA family protein [Leptospiraceae bacterium]
MKQSPRDSGPDTNNSKSTRNRWILWVLLLFCILLLGFSGLASVAYWRLQRESTARISHLEKEVATRQEQMNRMLKDQTGLEASLEEMKQALDELRARQAVADERLEAFRKLLESLKSLREAGSLSVRIVDGRAVLALPNDILFPSGSSELSARGKRTIRDLTAILSEISGQKFQIEGHTDSDPLYLRGQTNWELAADRALVVLHTMIDAGMEESRISAASFGPTRPVQSNQTPGGKARNRRIEIVLLPDLSILPGAEKMQELLRESR